MKCHRNECASFAALLASLHKAKIAISMFASADSKPAAQHAQPTHTLTQVTLYRSVLFDPETHECKHKLNAGTMSGPLMLWLRHAVQGGGRAGRHT